MEMTVSSRRSSTVTEPPAAEWPRRNGEDDLVPDQRLELERPVPAKRADDAELELPQRHLLADRLRVPDGEGHVELGVVALELAEEKRDEVRAGAGRGADRERALELAALGGDLVVELLLEGEHALRAAVEAEARLGRLDPAAGAVEQRLPEALLEGANLEADRGLRDAELLRGL